MSQRARSVRRYSGSLRIAFGCGADLHFAETVNLSTAGALIRSSRLLRQDALIALEIVLPERAEPLRCRGKVVWLNSGGSGRWPLPACGEIGVEFLDLSAADKIHLQNYLQCEGGKVVG